MIALLLVSLLQRELHQSGIDLSIPSMIEELSQIREVAILFDGEGNQKPKLTLSKLTSTQQKLFDVLQLKRYLEV